MLRKKHVISICHANVTGETLPGNNAAPQAARHTIAVAGRQTVLRNNTLIQLYFGAFKRGSTASVGTESAGVLHAAVSPAQISPRVLALSLQV
jgi:hypothetical protein